MTSTTQPEQQPLRMDALGRVRTPRERVEAVIADMDRLRDILARHSLLDAWAKFEKRFLQP